MYIYIYVNTAQKHLVMNLYAPFKKNKTRDSNLGIGTIARLIWHLSDLTSNIRHPSCLKKVHPRKLT